MYKKTDYYQTHVFMNMNYTHELPNKEMYIIFVRIQAITFTLNNRFNKEAIYILDQTSTQQLLYSENKYDPFPVLNTIIDSGCIFVLQERVKETLI